MRWPRPSGSGTETSIGGLVELVGRLLGRALEVENDPQRVRPSTSEVDRLVADSSRLRQQTGWAPAVGLEEGVARTIEWIRAHPDLFRPARYAV